MPQIKEYYLVILIGLWLTGISSALRQYFDGTGRVTVPMWIMVGANAQNILFNYLLIFGIGPFPELGLIGAGISTLASRITIVVATIAVMALRRRYKSDFRRFVASRFDRTSMRAITRASWPIALQSGLETGFFSIAGVMLGWIGAIALASYQVVMIAGMIGFMVYESFAAAACIRISHYYGLGEMRGVAVASRCGYAVVLFFMFVASAIFYLFGRHLVSLITPDPDVIALCVTLIPPLIAYQLADATQVVYCNCLRGISHVMPLSVVSFTAYILVGTPLCYLLGFGLNGGAVGIFYSFAGALMLAGALYALFFAIKLHSLQKSAAAGQ